MDEKPQFEQERITPTPFNFVLHVWKKWYLLYNKDVLPQKRDLVFYLTSLLTFYPLLKRSTWVLNLIVLLHVSVIVSGIWLNTKTGVKSSFSYFRPYYNWGTIW